MASRLAPIFRSAKPLRAPLRANARAPFTRRFASESQVVSAHPARAHTQPPPPPPGKSNVPYMLLAVGAAAGGAAYYFYGTAGSAADSANKADTAIRGAVASVEQSTGLRRGIQEYQKVYNRIAETLDVEDYDGQSRPAPVHPLTRQTAPSPPS